MAHFEHSSIITAPPQKVFDFISEPKNMGLTLPPDYKIIFNESPPPMKKGAQYEFRLSRFGVSVMWGIYVDEVVPGVQISQRQTHGPFLTWSHQTKVAEHGQGALLTDFIEYDLAFGLFGKLAEDLYLKNEFHRFFDFRHKKIEELLNTKK